MNISSSSLLNISLNDNNLLDFNISEESILNESNERDILIDKLMKLYSRHKLTKNAVEDVAKLINSVPGATVGIPTTKFVLFNEFLRKSQYNVFNYLFCASCDDYIEFPFGIKKDTKCTFCECTLVFNDKCFIYIQIEPQLRDIVKKYYVDIMKYKEKIKIKTDENITDVFDGHLIKEMKKTLATCTLTINTDGLIVHNSSQASLYPILFTCDFLPPEIRFKEKNIVVAGLYYGPHKPDYLKYLNPIVKEFELLGTTGLFENDSIFKFFVTHAAFDLPIKCVLQQITQYNGYSACFYCDHPGEKTDKGVRYTYIENFTVRNHSQMIRTINEVIKTGKTVNGIKGMSPMVGFNNFDLVNSFSIDYMHGVGLGVLKNLLHFWIDSTHKDEPYYIKPKQKLKLNLRLCGIKPCRFVNRRITCIEKYNTFKASQCRNFILYFYPVLNGILDQKYFKHFKLLCSSIYTLLKESISLEELQIAKQNLNSFVSQYELLYGKCSMTMNVHCLLHLVDCVKNLGPLWAYSMFTFESFNGTLRKYGENSNNVINQVIENIAIKSSESVSESVSEDIASVIVCQDKIKIKPTICDAVVLRQSKIVDERKYFATIKKGKTKFTSIEYTQAKKTVDYFVETTDNTFGKVKFYLESKNQIYALIQEYAIKNKMDQFFIVKETSNIIIKSSQNIREKLIYMKIDKEEIIVKRPNKYEVN